VTVADTSDIDPCPYCGGTSGVQQITNTPPKVQGWSCVACGTDWAITVVNPYPCLDRLTAAVLLRQMLVLADQAPSPSKTTSCGTGSLLWPQRLPDDHDR
jgi:hypothetical protein